MGYFSQKKPKIAFFQVLQIVLKGWMLHMHIYYYKINGEFIYVSSETVS